MKYLYILCLFFVASLLSLGAQGYDKSCYYGITFVVSENPSWGYGELVITGVEPNSPAEKSGIKVDDIIMEINGKATYLRDNQTIANWLFNVYDPVVTFTIRNLNTYFKEYTLNRRCIALNSVNEKELSDIFSFYSLENTNQRAFTLPLRVEPNAEVDYADYHTYDFQRDDNPTAVDLQITALLEKTLQARGLVRDTKDPEIIIQAYYNYDSNPQYTGLENNPSITSKVWRFDSDKKEMVQLPILDPNEYNIQAKGQYLAEFGFSFYDRKYIDETRLTQIWDCSIKDYLSTKYSFEEYLKLHIPLMFMEYPYVTAKTEVKYVVDFNGYNYTGMYFNADDLTTVSDVDEGSPAFAAGIRAGYVIKKINNKKFQHTKEKLSEGYKRFIDVTTIYRDQTTRFTNADGYADCMFWNPAFYGDIAKEFNKSSNLTNFSYLYDFEKYVNPNPSDRITIEAWDGMQTRIFQVTPTIRRSVVVKSL
ncbi:PDZ domain-containing protein [Dysgonomonas sp. ZJ709]|uniref:PDZ domain-containing protein n=1 Tax=Dysgonomonas sp. ZJ709 TaxID=2709797 RepID=UPI0013ED9B11|nr:PDZ domain-containing protein [Dysgonomonas sp. ZJ709]